MRGGALRRSAPLSLRLTSAQTFGTNSGMTGNTSTAAALASMNRAHIIRADLARHIIDALARATVLRSTAYAELRSLAARAVTLTGGEDMTVFSEIAATGAEENDTIEAIGMITAIIRGLSPAKRIKALAAVIAGCI